MIKVHFSDFFRVSRKALNDYGAFNVSMVADLPLFVDPFLLFNSRKKEYQKLHADIIQYLSFLRHQSSTRSLSAGLIDSWYRFPEVKQNWLGYSRTGNSGRGLGAKFSRSLNSNLSSIFSSFGSEKVTKGSHLEKLCLIDSGVGRDSISDFTTNLIKGFLLEYTQQFAKDSIPPRLRRAVTVNKVRFNYGTESWENGVFELPFVGQDYVLLTPKDMLTKDETWISQADLYGQFYSIADAMPNEQLRAQLNNFLRAALPKKPTAKDHLAIIQNALRRFPQVIEYYIRSKEENGDRAAAVSDLKVAETYALFVEQQSVLSQLLETETGFYDLEPDTYKEALSRALFLKDVVENKGGHKVFNPKGQPIHDEASLHILYRLTWYGTPSDISREVNDGRGPADFKASRGSQDKTIVEFKLASNSQLRRNLQNQVDIYKKASDAQSGISVIFYFSAKEREKVNKILNDLGLQGKEHIVLIDARDDNKPSGSVA